MSNLQLQSLSSNCLSSNYVHCAAVSTESAESTHAPGKEGANLCKQNPDYWSVLDPQFGHCRFLYHDGLWQACEHHDLDGRVGLCLYPFLCGALHEQCLLFGNRDGHGHGCGFVIGVAVIGVVEIGIVEIGGVVIGIVEIGDVEIGDVAIGAVEIGDVAIGGVEIGGVERHR